MKENVSKKKGFFSHLAKEARRYECFDINAEEKKTFYSRRKRPIICFIVSVVLAWLTKTGFSNEFVSFLATMLSIFIGLFSTTLVFALDKFYVTIEDKVRDFSISMTESEKERDILLSVEEIEDLNSRQNLWKKQAYNYVKQFTYIIGYNIVLSIIALTLISLNTLFLDLVNIDIFNYTFYTQNLELGNIVSFFHVAFVILQRFFIFYCTLSVLYNTLYAVSSMINFMIAKIDRTL